MKTARFRETKGVMFFRRIDPSTKAIFKATCVRRSNYMEDVIEAMMVCYAKHPEKYEDEVRKIQKRKGRGQ